MRKTNYKAFKISLTILFSALLFSAAVFTVLAATVDDNPKGTKLSELGVDDNMENNYGDITTLNGTVSFNFGNINNNVGTIEYNNWYIDYNNGTVGYNLFDGTIKYNNNAGTIKCNVDGSNIQRNYGVVTENNGMLWYNYGTVEQNYGKVGNNYSVVYSFLGSIVTSNYENYVVYNNSGTVVENYGITYNYNGLVMTNEGIVYDYNGTIDEDKGTVYKHVLTDIQNATVKFGDDFITYKDVYFVDKEASFVVEPIDYYEIDTVSYISYKDDGSECTKGTLTGNSGKYTLPYHSEARQYKLTVTTKKGSIEFTQRHKVTTIADDGIESVTADREYTCGETVTLNATVKDGYKFSGWSGDRTGNNTTLVFSMPESDVTLYVSTELKDSEKQNTTGSGGNASSSSSSTGSSGAGTGSSDTGVSGGTSSTGGTNNSGNTGAGIGNSGSDAISKNEIIAEDYILLTVTAKGKRKQNLTWTRVYGATKYEIYAKPCSGKSKYKKIKTISNDMTTWTRTGLKKHTAYKYYIVAYNNNSVLAKSLVMHAYTSGYAGKYGNTTKVTMKESSVTLNVGETKKLTLKKLKNVKNKTWLKGHVKYKLRFISSDEKIVRVNKSTGKISALTTGDAVIYCISPNGVRAEVKVSVN